MRIKYVFEKDLFFFIDEDEEEMDEGDVRRKCSAEDNIIRERKGIERERIIM